MRRPQACFDGAMRLVVEGVSQASIARAQGVAPATVSRWIERAARHGSRFLETKLRPESASEVQIDELKARAGDQDRTWVYGAIEVWSRLWLAHWVGPRTLRSTLIFVRALRGACGSLRERILFTSDEFKYYAPTLRRTFGQACVHVEVKNRYLRNRILSSESRVRFGTADQADEALARSEDSRRPNTAFIERLNLFKRRACPYLHRRTPSPMRKPQRLDQHITILRCFYNFIRPHASLRFGRVTRTPAMQAGLTTRALGFREIFRCVLPPPAPFQKLRPAFPP